jgi:hypothetical protein
MQSYPVCTHDAQSIAYIRDVLSEGNNARTENAPMLMPDIFFIAKYLQYTTLY